MVAGADANIGASEGPVELVNAAEEARIAVGVLMEVHELEMMPEEEGPCVEKLEGAMEVGDSTTVLENVDEGLDSRAEKFENEAKVVLVSHCDGGKLRILLIGVFEFAEIEVVEYKCVDSDSEEFDLVDTTIGEVVNVDATLVEAVWVGFTGLILLEEGEIPGQVDTVYCQRYESRNRRYGSLGAVVRTKGVQLANGELRKKAKMELEPWSRHKVAVPFRNDLLFHLRVLPKSCHVPLMLPIAVEGAKGINVTPDHVE